ncbi:malonate decarboxylase subunit delta [Pseudomonas matsuisoli]|nr:malonate decarboxylase subunit delta [Pseudomonas matsuisoli]
METLTFQYPAGRPGRTRALVGCVGSGDLEVLLEPADEGQLTIQVITSVNGASHRWQQLFERMFNSQTPPALHIDIHDFGATPGVVRLRLEQGFEEVGHD